MTSALLTSGDVDHSLMKEFFDDFNETHDLCEEVILQLESNPEDKNLVNKIFRAVHNVKGNLIYVNLKHLTPLLQSIEDVLDDIRNQIIPYNTGLSDVILLSLDTTRVLVMERVEDIEHSIEAAHFREICDAIHSICESSNAKLSTTIDTALTLLNQPNPSDENQNPSIDPTGEQAHNTPPPETNSISPKTHTILDLKFNAPPSQQRTAGPTTSSQQSGMLVTKINAQPQPQPQPHRQRHTENPPADQPSLEADIITNKFGDELNADMEFFASLSKHIETRSFYWRGRTERILELALAMNTLKGERTDPAQLSAAVYMHDFGMAFLPIQLLHKKDRLSLGDNIKIRRHPKMAYDFLRRMGQWDMAATISIQHHERLDGNGYPRGLKASEICDGAKILSIIDTFDARTHDRAHSESSKHALISSVFELNRHAGGQFSEYWIDAFQTVLNQQQK